VEGKSGADPAADLPPDPVSVSAVPIARGAGGRFVPLAAVQKSTAPAADKVANGNGDAEEIPQG
jgi:hypothetical protein